MKVLKFGAVWCKECLVMRPMWAEIEKAMPALKTEYFDGDEHPELLEKYKIEVLPAFIFLDESGNEIARLVGAQNKEKLIEMIKIYIDKQ